MSKKRLKVIVLMGGPSSEYEVSLATAKNIISALDPQKYQIFPLRIPKTRNWSEEIRKGIHQTQPEVVFIAMHGEYGEDGRVQSLLELAGIPYTGSGVLASALAMDKVKSARFLESCGLTTPKYTAFKKTDWDKNKKEGFVNIKKLGWPLVIKPANLGSSVGVSIIKNKNGLRAAFKKVWQNSDYLMTQEFIKGREVTCGVLEDPKTGKPFALPPTEIIPPKSSFWDYDAKYKPGASEEITPARFSKKVLQAVQKSALEAHTALGCRGMSRTDMIVSGAKKVYVLELNTIPGMTETSVLPQGARAAGISFPKLVDIIISRALS